MIGKVINGKFQIVRLIESGGMGEVYEAVKLDDKSRLAIKLPHQHLMRDAQIAHRFEFEAKIACKASHKNIVKGVEYGSFEGRPYLAMEYVEGISVKQYLGSKKKLPVQEAIHIIIQVTEALNYLHQNKMIKAHRDIKPSNIMLTTDHTIKLMDFGVSKTHAESEFTKTKTQIGVINYVSPEQIKDPKRVGVHSDIWSLGVIFYELVSGRKPFEGENEPSVIFKILYSTPAPLEANVYDRACWEVIEKQLQREPSRRYSSPEELLENLRVLEKNLKTGKNLPTITFDAASGRKKRGLLKYAFSALVVFLTAGLLWQFVLKNNSLIERELEKYTLKPEAPAQTSEKNRYSPRISFSGQPEYNRDKRELELVLSYNDRDGDKPASFSYLYSGKTYPIDNKYITASDAGKEKSTGYFRGSYRILLPLDSEKSLSAVKKELDIAFEVSDGGKTGKSETKYIVLEAGSAPKGGIHGNPEEGPPQPEDLK